MLPQYILFLKRRSELKVGGGGAKKMPNVELCGGVRGILLGPVVQKAD